MKKVIVVCTTALLGACGSGSDSSSDTDSITDPATDPIVNPVLPRDWTPVAGEATYTFTGGQDFLQFIPGLALSELTLASQGRELFVADWTMAPGSRDLLDGLGPLFVSDACDNCHLANGRAASLNADGTIGEGLLFRLGNSLGQPDPHYGGQLQHRATVGNPEGSVSWQDIGEGRPLFAFTSAGQDLGEGISLGPRQSPQLTGVGLLELVPQEQLLQWHDPDDADGDGISGRAHQLQREGVDCLGRFGWKAMHCTLQGQSAGALQQDMGLTTPLNPQEPCTASQSICSDQPSGGSPEVSEFSLNAINEFLTLLAVPERRISDQLVFDHGADLFDQIGCADCHRPTLVTGEHAKFSQLSHQVIYAYTDLIEVTATGTF